MEVCEGHAFHLQPLARIARIPSPAESGSACKSFCAGRVGLLLTKELDEVAKIQAYFVGEVDENIEVLFIKYIDEHLRRNVKDPDDVKMFREYICPHCQTPVENKKSINKKLAEGKTSIICVECEERVPLIDKVHEKFNSEEFAQGVRKMDEQAQEGLDRESSEVVLFGHAVSVTSEAGHIFHHEAKPALGIDGEIEFKNDKGEASGQKLYLKLKAGGSYRKRQDRGGSEVIEFDNLDHAEQWQASDHPVMLVIRDADEKIRWMNVTNYLKRHGTKSKKIGFEGEPFTAVNIHKIWRKMTASDA